MSQGFGANSDFWKKLGGQLTSVSWPLFCVSDAVNGRSLGEGAFRGAMQAEFGLPGREMGEKGYNSYAIWCGWRGILEGKF